MEFGLISLIIIVIVKQYRPEFVLYVSLAAGVLILVMIMDKIGAIIDLLTTLSNKTAINNEFLILLIKITGIAFLTEFTVSICKDTGETAIANKVDLGGKVLIISMSIPIIASLLETILKLLPWKGIKQMKKIFIMTILFLIFIPSICTATETTSQDVLQSQQEELNISSFIKEAQKYTQNTFKDIDVNELFTSAITGKIDNDTIIKSIVSLVGKEVLNCATVLGSILVIIIIHSILKSISEGLENKNVAQITYYVQYILIVTLIMANFSDILQMVKTSIQNLVGFMNSLVPLLITLMLTTGNFASAGILEPIILFIITFIGNFITTILLPIVLISTALAIISKVSSRIQVDKLSKFFNSTVVWTLGVVLTLFVGIISVEGSLSSTVDGITAKTTKAAVSNFIPVVGKILGDAVDTVMGCSNILKNAVGIVGVVVVIAICVGPIIKLAILMGLYYLAGAVCQPIADEKIVKLLEEMGNTFKMLLAIMCSVSVMLIIGTTLVLKITNSGLMYR